MKLGALYRVSDNRCLVPSVWRAVSTLERMRGLLGRPPLSSGEGLLIESCNMVHTIGMGYELDLVFLNATGHVQKVVQELKPLRFAGAFSANSSLELPAGTLGTLELRLGEQLIWQATSS